MKLWGISMGVHEEIIFQIVHYLELRRDVEYEEAHMNPPVQSPFSRWAVNAIIDELKEDETSYPDEIVRRFISLMQKYEDAAEPERKRLFQIARETAENLYSYLFSCERTIEEDTPF